MNMRYGAYSEGQEGGELLGLRFAVEARLRIDIQRADGESLAQAGGQQDLEHHTLTSKLLPAHSYPGIVQAD